MPRPLPPLNALRAFESAARHLSFTRAADEMNVTQAAISHQGQALLPDLRDAFSRMALAVERISARSAIGTLTVSSMTTIVMTWLVPRLPRFQAAHPEIDVRMMTTQRLVDFAREDIDVGIRFGTGKWPGVKVERMFGEVLTPLVGRRLIEQVRTPEDLRELPLLRTTEEDEWPIWFAAAGVRAIDVIRGPMFDSTMIAVQAAIDGLGIVMGPPSLFVDDIAAGKLFQPFPLAVETGKSYWFVVPEASAGRPKVKAFRDWVFAEIARSEAAAKP